MLHTVSRYPLILFMLFILLGWLLPATVPALEQGEAAPASTPHRQETISTLRSLLKLQSELKRNIQDLNEQLAAAGTAGEKKDLQAQLDKLEIDLQTTTRNLREIAAGADIASLRATEEQKFSLQEELFALLKPALKEMRDMTSHVRIKSELKDKIAYYKSKQVVAELAIANLSGLLTENEDEPLDRHLESRLAEWRQQLTVIQGDQQSAELQLEKLESSESSLADASQSYLKSFFQKRGLYLTQAILAVVGVLLLSRLSYRAIVKLVPGYRDEHRSFRIRLLDLVHRIITVMLAITGPMVVFYLVEDWVLFSLGLLLLLGIALTLRNALPRYWQQIQLFLNVGSVREGERIDLDGLPWRVRQINIFSLLDNPTADLCQRIRIDDLVDLKSRPVKRDDPWFPCIKGDWVMLSDGMRGKVAGISQELVELIERGGAHRTYLTANFLALSPNNLSRNFRLKETIGISYKLQRESVAGIPDTLKGHIEKRIADEGYADKLHNLRVEFEKANTSSLDIVVIADFDGELADLYGRLRRAMQRWCVEACNEHGWEIPFTQLTLHQAKITDA
jgi:small-conductance mechanosensitive channel